MNIEAPRGVLVKKSHVSVRAACFVPEAPCLGDWPRAWLHLGGLAYRAQGSQKLLALRSARRLLRWSSSHPSNSFLKLEITKTRLIANLKLVSLKARSFTYKSVYILARSVCRRGYSYRIPISVIITTPFSIKERTFKFYIFIIFYFYKPVRSQILNFPNFLYNYTLCFIIPRVF